jgi:putative transposase
LLTWHRVLVRRKWTHKPKRKPGRPRKHPDLEALVVRMKRESPRWGYDKIEGELLKLGFDIDSSTVRNILIRHGLVPAPDQPCSSWRPFLSHYRDQFLACDFFTVETLWLRTLYVLFFIEHGSRRVFIAGCTEHPTSAWVTQQARQLTWQLEDRDPPLRFLIHDHDSKFTSGFDTVFEAERIALIHTPFHAPNAIAIAERWIRSVREECLDHLIILDARHLRRVLKEHACYYNEARPHQGLVQTTPIPFERPVSDGAVRCRDILGGIIHDYYREAA